MVGRFPEDSERSANARVGKYEIIRRLAIGGMAEIFLARATGIKGFEKVVVLKRILPQYAQDGHFIRMFLREARLVATLHHANIAQVFDIDVVGGSYFFTMEYIHGVDVRQLMRAALERQEDIPLEHALAICISTSAGLHHAHEKVLPDGRPAGIVHRDVSPSNILVGYDGAVKLVDFGIAKASDQPTETRPGTLKGKVAYMSPEQCLTESLDRRSDIFSLGILLYELTTTSCLFPGPNEMLVFRQIVDEPIPPPSERMPGFPPALARIVMKALEKRREDRYQTARELQADLEAFAHESRLRTSPMRLSDYVERLFGKNVADWREAQQAGRTLVEYLTAPAATAGVVAADDRTAPIGGSTSLGGPAPFVPQPVAPMPAITPPESSSNALPRRSHRSVAAIVAVTIAAAGSVLVLSRKTRVPPQNVMIAHPLPQPKPTVPDGALAAPLRAPSVAASAQAPASSKQGTTQRPKASRKQRVTKERQASGMTPTARSAPRSPALPVPVAAPPVEQKQMEPKKEIKKNLDSIFEGR